MPRVNLRKPLDVHLSALIPHSFSLGQSSYLALTALITDLQLSFPSSVINSHSKQLFAQSYAVPHSKTNAAFLFVTGCPHSSAFNPHSFPFHGFTQVMRRHNCVTQTLAAYICYPSLRHCCIHLLLAAAHFKPKNCPLTDPPYISQIHHVLAKICTSRLAKSLRKNIGKFSSVKTNNDFFKNLSPT